MTVTSNLEMLLLVSGVLVSGVIALVRFGFWIGRLSRQVDMLARQLETVKDFLIRRAKVEMIQHGWGVLHSPLSLTPEGLDALRPYVDPYLDQFLPVYAQATDGTPAMTERELFFEFERRFGDLLMERFCIPLHLSKGECVVAILKVCELVAGLSPGPGPGSPTD